MKANFYDFILQGHEATEANAYDHARGQDWQSIETTEENISCLTYIDSVNGVEIWHCQYLNYYCFIPTES